MRVTHTDYAALDLAKPVTQSNGWLRTEGFIGRTGILEYPQPNGTVRREYRAPDVAFDPATLSSFALMPLTNDHPPDGQLTAENTREHQVGTVEQPRRDGDRMRAGILITDAATIADVKAGKVQLSSGYTCDLEGPAGVTPDGQRYDVRQVRVRGNHVALVDAGRAGPSVALRADAQAPSLTRQSSRELAEDMKRRSREAHQAHLEPAPTTHADARPKMSWELAEDMKRRSREAYKATGGDR